MKSLGLWKDIHSALFLEKRNLEETSWNIQDYMKKTSLISQSHKILGKLMEASFIEWRYYSVYSKDFHGIVGLSFYNPQEHFAGLSDGGLLLIVSGVLGDSLLRSFVDEVPDFCWMSLMPYSKLCIEGSDISFKEEHLSFSLKVNEKHEAILFLEGKEAPSLSFRTTVVDGLPWSDPLQGYFSHHPVAHWVVHNPHPLCHTQGSLHFSQEFKDHFNVKKKSFPNFVSSKALSLMNSEISLEGEGYYEHSFGVNPMPYHGWDFCFAPSFSLGGGFVLQSYKNTDDLTALDFFWKKNEQWEVIRFKGKEINVEWKETICHPFIRKKVPIKRLIRAENELFKIEIHNNIKHIIPFLRPSCFVLNHYYIGEEIGASSLLFQDKEGNTLFQLSNIPSGGETSSLRLKT